MTARVMAALGVMLSVGLGLAAMSAAAPAPVLSAPAPVGPPAPPLVGPPAPPLVGPPAPPLVDPPAPPLVDPPAPESKSADPKSAPPREAKPALTVEQIITLLKVGSPAEQIVRDVRSSAGRYRISNEQYAQLRSAGATQDLLELLTGELSEPLTEAELIAIAKLALSDSKKSELLKFRQLGFKLDYATKRRLVTAEPDDPKFAKNMGDLLQLLTARQSLGRSVTRSGSDDLGGSPEPGGRAGVVVRDWTYELSDSRLALYTFTLENQLDVPVRDIKITTEYLVNFEGGKRIVFSEQSSDLGRLDAFERKRVTRLRLHRAIQPAKFAEVQFAVNWRRDESAPPADAGKIGPREVEQSLVLIQQVGFLATSPAPEWEHRFTVVNKGGFAVRNPTLLLRILDAEGRPLWFHEHTIEATLLPGEIRRERIEPISLDGLWDRSRGEWRVAPSDMRRSLAPAKAELVFLRGSPIELPPERQPPRMLEICEPLQVVQFTTSWIGQPSPSTIPHYYRLTVVNPHPFAVRDVTLLVRFTDSAGKPVNYETLVTLRQPVAAMTARRFEIAPPTLQHGLSTESDRAADFEAHIIAATPVPEAAPAPR